MWSLFYTDDPPVYWKTDFGPTGALKAYLEADRKAPTGGFVSAEAGLMLPTLLKHGADVPLRKKRSTTASSTPSAVATTPRSTSSGRSTAT